MTSPDPTALAGIIAGNEDIQTRPNLVGAMLSGNVSPQQAQTINQFTQGLNLEAAVRTARATGQNLPLTTYEQTLLGQMGVKYSDVYKSQQQYASDITAHGMVPVYGPDGTLIGSRMKTQQESNRHAPGWFDSAGGFFHHLVHNPVTNTVAGAGNMVNSELGNLFESSDQLHQNNELMRSMGYDPNNGFSVIAFEAKGYARGDITGLVKKYGQDRVNQAEQYLADPKGFVDGLLKGAKSTDEATALLGQTTGDPEFNALLQEMAGRTAGVGGDLALRVGLDPLKNPGAYGAVSGITNFVASLATDPTLALGRAVKVANISAKGIKGFQDTSTMARILSKDQSDTNLIRRAVNVVGGRARVQNGFQSLVDNGNMIREGLDARAAAQAAGDLEGVAKANGQVAKGYQRIRVMTPGLEPLVPALTGEHQVQGIDAAGKLITGAGDPIDTYEKLFEYVTGTKGMLALQSGKAAIESNLMPGALSSWGARRVRGALAGAPRGPRGAPPLSKTGVAAKLLPAADDAEHVLTGQAMSAKEAAVTDAQASVDRYNEAVAKGMQPDQAFESELQQGLVSAKAELASAKRAADTASASQMGQALFNQRLTGDAGKGLAAGQDVPMAGRIASWINPSAIAARMRLARARTAAFLPRNNAIDLADENSVDKVYQFSRLYLPKSQAALNAATYAAGDIGVRRAIFQGMKAQVFHAAGFGHTEAGRDLIGRFLKEDEQVYGHSGIGTMEKDPWTGERDVSSALYPGQVRTEYQLPDFKQMHQAAAKIGLFESTLGRFASSKIADAFGSVIRYGWLMKPSTFTRNAPEGWLNALTRGDARAAVAAKAHLVDNAMLPERTKLTQKALGWVVPRKVGQLIRVAEKRAARPEDGLEYLDRFAETFPGQAEEIAHSLGRQQLMSDLSPAGQAADAHDLALAGFRPSLFKLQGFEEKDVQGLDGAERLSGALALRMHKAQDLMSAIIAHHADPSGSLDGIVNVLKSKQIQPWVDRMRWSRVYRDENGNLQRVVTDEQKALALKQHAGMLSEDMRYLLTGQNGEYAQNLADELAKGRVPDAEWIHANLPGEARPKSAIAPVYVPKVIEDTDTVAAARQKIAQGLQDLSGKYYDKVVETPILRTTSMPVFWRNYARARYEMKDLEDELTQAGWSKDSIETALTNRGFRQAWQRTEQTIDDPGQKTQFDVVGRNFLAFPRAMQAFIRRWGQRVAVDPTILRKGALALNGLEHTGLIYRDQNGELTFTYPGTGFLVDGLMKAGQALGISNLVQIPISSAMTGKVMLAAPGFENPFRFGMSPMVNIPFRYIANLVPEHRQMFDRIDEILNGQQGVGQSPLSEVMPAGLKKFWDALNPDDRNGLLASATTQAISNLVAADPNGQKGIVPVGADPDGTKGQEFVGKIKDQVQQQLLLRAVFGLFTLAAPSRPGDQTGASEKVDYAYMVRGARSLSDEYKMMLNDANGDAAVASQAFLEKHPNGLIYTMPTSGVTQAKADVPSTASAEAWMENHVDFLRKYNKVAAYFIPQESGSFDPSAYRSSLALGIRQKKSISEFYNQYALRAAQSSYYAAMDQRDSRIAEAQANGNTAAVAQIKANFKQQMEPFLAANPMLRADLAAGNGDRDAAASIALAQLQSILADPPKGIDERTVQAARLMVEASQAHQAYGMAHTSRDAVTSAQKTAEVQRYHRYMLQVVSGAPELTDLYRGVFRQLDSSLPVPGDYQGSA